MNFLCVTFTCYYVVDLIVKRQLCLHYTYNLNMLICKIVAHWLHSGSFTTELTDSLVFCCKLCFCNCCLFLVVVCCVQMRRLILEFKKSKALNLLQKCCHLPVRCGAELLCAIFGCHCTQDYIQSPLSNSILYFLFFVIFYVCKFEINKSF